MKLLQRAMSSPGRRLVFMLLLAAGGVAHAQKYRIAFEPQSNSTDPAACAAAGAKWYPTAAEACQGATTALPLCDRNTATYKNYVAQLTSPTICHVQWEYLNNGSTVWASWSGSYGITTQRVFDIYRNCKQSPCPMRAGNPIYPLTGSKQEFVETGLAVGGQSLRLTYNSVRASVATAAGVSAKELGDLPALGALWLSSLHRKLLIADPVFGAKLFRGDGTVVHFRSQGGVFVADGDVIGQLTSVSGTYRYVDPVSQSIETYNSSGQLMSLVDTVGNALTFAYSMGSNVTAPAAGYLMEVTDSAGRSIRFEYMLPAGGTAAYDGLVSRIIDATGQAMTAGYDANGNLVSLTWSDGKVRQFLYENPALPWALTGVVDENNSRYATFSYDSAGLATATGYTGGVSQYSVNYRTPPAVVITEVYDSASDILYRYHDWQSPAGTTLLTPDGQSVEVSAITILGGNLLSGTTQPAGSGCAASSNGITYDANGNPLSRDDFSGLRTCYAYDSKNREIVRVEGLANTVACSSVTPLGAMLPAGARRITTAWHPDWHLPVWSDQPQRRITTVYHGRPDPLNNNFAANCTAAANLPNGKPLPVVCKTVAQATTSVLSGGSTDNAYANVLLLLAGEGANGSTAFLDSSSTPKTVSASGSTKISTAQAKYGLGSIYFDGSASCLSSPASNNWSLGAGDFTVELWYSPLAAVSSRLVTSRLPQGGAAGTWGFNISGTTLSFTEVVVGEPGVSASYAFSTGGWYHLAASRSAGVLRLFVNGVQVASGANSTNFGNTAYALNIGCSPSENYLNGYMDELRITKGVARYTAGFTPPESADVYAAVDVNTPMAVSSYTYDNAGRVLTSSDANNRTTSYAYYADRAFTDSLPGSYDSDYEKVTLLLHGNGVDGSTTVGDDSVGRRAVAVAGDAKISVAQSMFGGSSMFFDGTGDSLSVAASNDFDLGSSDFTVEFWYYPVAISAGNGILGTWDTTAGQYSWLVAHPNPGQPGAPPKERIRFVASADGNYNGNTRDFYGTGAGSAIALNAWQHIAVVRASGIFRLFLNGTLLTTTAIGSQPSSGTFTVFNNNKPFKAGAFDSTANGGVNGYIDDLRLTKGKARYTTSFTPPTQEFANRPENIGLSDTGHAVGDLQSITNAAGHVTQFTQYDRAGRVRQMIDPKGVVTDISYTPRGWVSTVTTTAPGGAGRTTSYTYDGVGQLTGVTQPDGTSLSYSYDAAHRLVGVTDAKGNSVNYTLDNVGNRIAEEIKDPSGNLQRSIARSFDALNRLQQVTGAAR